MRPGCVEVSPCDGSKRRTASRWRRSGPSTLGGGWSQPRGPPKRRKSDPATREDLRALQSWPRGWLIRPVRQCGTSIRQLVDPMVAGGRPTTRPRAGSKRQKESPGGWEPRRDPGRCLGSRHPRTQFEGCRLAIRLIARFFGKIFNEFSAAVFLQRWFAAPGFGGTPSDALLIGLCQPMRRGCAIECCRFR
jgi:hypothetical protein